jgi:hypothetical protein
MSETPSTPATGLGESRPALNAPTPTGGVTSRLRARDATERAISNEANEQADAKQAVVDAVENKETERKAGLSWDDSIREMEEAAPHLAKMARELRADYTRKTQSLSAEKKRLTADQQALIKSGTLDALRAKANEDVGELNPFDEGSISARIEREVARRLAEALEPMEREHQQAAARTKYEGFLDKHPDLSTDKETRKEVFEALKKNPGLDLQSAYYAVRGRRASSLDTQRAATKKAEQKAARAAALTATGQGRRAGTPTISKTDAKGMSAWDIYQNLKRAQSR